MRVSLAYHIRLIMQHPGSLPVPISGRHEGSSALGFLQRMQCGLGFRPPKCGGMFVPWCHWRLACDWGRVVCKYFRWKPGIFSWDIVVCLEAHRRRERVIPWALPQPDWVTRVRDECHLGTLGRRPHICCKQNSSISLVPKASDLFFSS